MQAPSMSPTGACCVALDWGDEGTALCPPHVRRLLCPCEAARSRSCPIFTRSAPPPSPTPPPPRSNNNQVRKIDVATAEVSLFAGSPSGTGGDPGNAQGTNALFNCPSGVAVNSADARLYVSDQKNHVIRLIELNAARMVYTLAGQYLGVGYAGGSADGIAGVVQYKSPNGLAYFPGSATMGAKLFVADLGGSTIRSIDVVTTTTTTLAGKYEVVSRVDGTGSNANFRNPVDVAVDSLGLLLYVADRDSNVVRAVNISSGLVTTLAGPPTGTNPAAGFADGVRALATFTRPAGVCINPADTVLYSADEE